MTISNNHLWNLQKEHGTPQRKFHLDWGNPSQQTPPKDQLWITNCSGQFQGAKLRWSRLTDYCSQDLRQPCTFPLERDWTTDDATALSELDNYPRFLMPWALFFLDLHIPSSSWSPLLSASYLSLSIFHAVAQLFHWDWVRFSFLAQPGSPADGFVVLDAG